MSVPEELLWLLNQLRNTPQPRERLRLLALGWRTLKELSPTDRLRIARELGFDGAERLVEELSRRGGMSPSKLLGLLRGAESADPVRLRAMVTGLMDSDGRAEIVDRLADEAADLLRDDGVPDSDEIIDAIGEALSPEPVAREPADNALPPLPAADLESGRKAPPAAGPTLAASVAAAALDAKEVAGDFMEEHEAGGPPEDPRTEHRVIVDDDGEELGETSPEVADVVEPGPAQRTAKDTIEVQAPENGEESVDRSSAPGGVRDPASRDVESVLATLATEASLIRRLRALRESADGLVDVDVFGMRRLMELFPPGWARRRALETVLRAGLPRDLGAAVAMVDVLEGSGPRLWALTALADARSLDDEEKEQLLAASGSKLVERRLRVRLR